ncbi:MAG: alpha/beta fold hydrolase [Planctomycetes bacterium]|nr:alpha/beta fold hydrolase [Planctomycetota bacterium]
MNPANLPPFEPHPWLRGAHAQTLAGVYLPGHAVPYRAVQHRVALDDGDTIVLHDDQPAEWRPGERVVLLMHGLCGSHQSGYMCRIADKLNARGVRTFRLDLRGCGAGAGLARLPYHSGRSADAAAAIERVAAFCPDAPLTLVGFSLGGNITLKLLGEIGARPVGNLDSAVAVCPPINLAGCCRGLQVGLRRGYDRYFARQLRQMLRELARLVADPPPAQFAREPRSVWDFDDVYTAPVSGFGTAENYYAQCSAGPLVARIQLPTLIVASRDDPMVAADDFDRLTLPSAVQLHMTERGGHLGFIARGGVDPDRRWLDWRVVDWVLAQRDATALGLKTF